MVFFLIVELDTKSSVFMPFNYILFEVFLNVMLPLTSSRQLTPSRRKLTAVSKKFSDIYAKLSGEISSKSSANSKAMELSHI